MYGDYEKHAVRSAAILTTSYVAGTVINNVYDKNQLVVFVDFTKGSLTSAQIKIEYSNDGGTSWFQQSVKNISGGTTSIILNENELISTGKYEISTPFKAKDIRISVKGTGTVTGSSMAVEAVTGSN